MVAWMSLNHRPHPYQFDPGRCHVAVASAGSSDWGALVAAAVRSCCRHCCRQPCDSSSRFVPCFFPVLLVSGQPLAVAAVDTGSRIDPR